MILEEAERAEERISSPCTRRDDPKFVFKLYTDQKVVPARAGMILAKPASSATVSSSPCTRRDDPEMILRT